MDVATAVRWVLVVLFGIMGFGLLSGAQGAGGRVRVALLAGAACYMGGAVFAVAQRSMLPLAVGFAAAWVLRLIGQDPGSAGRGVPLDIPGVGRARMAVVPQMQLAHALLAAGFDGPTTEQVVEAYWRLKQPGASISEESLPCLQVLQSMGMLEAEESTTASRG